MTVAGTADGVKSATAFIAKPAAGVQEPAAYEGTMYVTYQAPVVRNGKTIGFAGTANTLAGVDATISKTKLLKTGYAFAVSGKGVFVSSPDKKNNGKLSLAKLADQKGNPELKQVADSIAAGKDGQLETKDPFTGKDIVLTWSQIDSAGWSFLTAVPVSEVLAPVAGLKKALFVIGLVMLLLVTLAIVFVANLLTKPIRTVTDAAERLADGDVDVDVEVHSKDEVGRLAASFGRTVEYLREKATAAEAVADGDLTVSVTPRSEKDLLGNAFQRLVSDLRTIVGQVSSTASGVTDVLARRWPTPPTRPAARSRRSRPRSARSPRAPTSRSRRSRSSARRPPAPPRRPATAPSAPTRPPRPPSRPRASPPRASSPPTRRPPPCAAWPSPPRA